MATIRKADDNDVKALSMELLSLLEDKKSGIYVDNVANFCILGKKEGRESTIHDPEA